MVRSGYPQTTSQVTTLLPLMRNKCLLIQWPSPRNQLGFWCRGCL